MATLEDIARTLGVSKGTVSKALSGAGGRQRCHAQIGGRDRRGAGLFPHLPEGRIAPHRSFHHQHGLRKAGGLRLRHPGGVPEAGRAGRLPGGGRAAELCIGKQRPLRRLHDAAQLPRRPVSGPFAQRPLAGGLQDLQDPCRALRQLCAGEPPGHQHQRGQWPRPWTRPSAT